MRSITGAILILAAAVLIAGGLTGGHLRDTTEVSFAYAFPVGIVGIAILIWGLITEQPPKQ